MPARRLLVVALLLVGVALATCEEAFLHSQLGCSSGTDCSACLLRLGTTGIVPTVDHPPPTAPTPDRPGVERRVPHRAPVVRQLPSRGPPRA